MVKRKKIQRTLEDLIIINNDRVKLYEKALSEMHEIDEPLQALFTEMADQSRLFRNELHQKITLMGEEDSTESTTAAGKLNRVLLDVKNIFTNNTTRTILDACEVAEDTAQQAYNEALKDTVYMDEQTIRLIEWQRDALKDSHDLIKRYRDEQAV